MIRALVVMTLVLVAGCRDSNTFELSGSELAADVGCLACHGETDSELAPTLHGMWGTQAELADGRTVVADEDYVRRAITDPAADVVVGYGPTMPPVPLEEAEVERLVEWVESLR